MNGYGKVLVTYGGSAFKPLAMDLSGSGGDADVLAAAPAYDVAGGTGRRSRAWRVGSFGPNTAITYSLDELRRKSRDQNRKNPLAGSATDKLVSNIVGTGVSPRSTAARSTAGLSKAKAKKTAQEDAAFRAEIQRLHLEWTDEADSVGAHDYYGLQALAVRGMIEGGETFTRLRTRLLTDGLTVPLQLQLLEGDHCPHLKTEPSNRIRQGIQYDAIGARSGYYLYREHPGDGVLAANGLELTLVPARDICHLYRALRPGQDRGEPWLARALRTLYDLDAYLDAELVRKKNAARFLGFIKKVQEGLDSDLDPQRAGPLGSDIDDDGAATLSLDPGTLQVLADGEDVTFSTPPDTGPNFEKFVREAKRNVAVAVGVLYEELSGDYSSMNDRSLRAAFNAFRRSVEMWQHQQLVFQFCRPIWNRWIDLAVLSGALQLPAGMTPAQARSVKWIPQAWPYIHPVQDVQGKTMEIQAGLSTRTQKVSEGGYDSETVDAENAADNARADALGLAYTSDGRRPATNGGAPATARGSAASDDAPASSDAADETARTSD